MKQLVWKELREHFKVALVGLVVFVVMLVLAFSASRQAANAAVVGVHTTAEAVQPLLAKSLLTQATFFCAIFGALLGWLQIQAEKHPDLWAFLVHRPVTRATILRSKLLGGLILYTAGAGLPGLGLVIVASIPGKIAAPFAGAMALPLVAIFLAGALWYLAGLLIGLRKARWYGSRGAGLGPALLATVGALVVHEFWQALLILAGAGLVLFPAVWGSFQTGGSYRDQPLLGKGAVTLAAAILAAVLMGVLLGVVSNLFESTYSFDYSSYQFTKEGEVIKISRHGPDEYEAVDLNGKPLLDEKTGQKLKPGVVWRRFAVGLSAWGAFANERRRGNGFNKYVNPGRFFRPWRMLDKTLWYLTADGRLVAYDWLTRKQVATLTPQGTPLQGAADDSRFVAGPSASNASFVRSEMPEVLPSARTAYLVDLEQRQLRPIFTVAQGDAVGAFTEVGFMNVPFVLVLTRQSVRLLDLQGNPKFQMPYAPTAATHSSVTVYSLEPTNTFAVRFDPDYRRNEKLGRTLRTHVTWVNADGSVRSSMDLPPLPQPRRDLPEGKFFVVLTPLAVPIYSWEKPYRLANVLRGVLAFLCAAAGWVLGTRNQFALRAKIGWGIFIFLLGLPGLLAFLAVQEWPAKEVCSHCGKLRAVNRERCEHCGAGVPPPERIGTEIFEPLTAG